MIATSPDSTLPDDADKDSQKNRLHSSRTRPLVLGMALGLIAALAVIAVAMIATRRNTPRLTQAAYEAAVERWKKNGPADYELDLDLSGNRPGSIHVEVRGGEVVHMTRDGVEPQQRRTWDYWSVPGQLETILQELEMARDPAGSFKMPGVTGMVMWAEFDPKFGYPLSYDRVVLGGDFEVHWKVTRFRDLSGKN